MFSSYPLCYLKHAVILFHTKNPQFALFVSASCLSKCCLFFSAFLYDLFLNSFLFLFFISFVILQMEVLDKLVCLSVFPSCSEKCVQLLFLAIKPQPCGSASICFHMFFPKSDLSFPIPEPALLQHWL